MRTIVVSGARSGVGKTSLARRICSILPGALHVKIGHGRKKRGMGNLFYETGTPPGPILEENAGIPFLVIESNTILRDLEPDLAIYIPADDPKPSASLAAEKADIVRGETGEEDAAALAASRLGIDGESARRLAEVACRGERTGDG